MSFKNKVPKNMLISRSEHTQIRFKTIALDVHERASEKVTFLFIHFEFTRHCTVLRVE